MNQTDGKPMDPDQIVAVVMDALRAAHIEEVGVICFGDAIDT
jgi:hypothetical protein